MEKIEAIGIVRKACKTKKQKEAFDLLFRKDVSLKERAHQCNYYHELCSRCLNWPTPMDIEADYADDCCTEHSMAAFYMYQLKLAETGECKYFVER